MELVGRFCYMLVKTDAIILHLQKYKDNTSILHAFTNDYGRINFIAYGVGGKKGKIPNAYFIPLNRAEFVFNYNSTKTIQQLKEINIKHYNNIESDIYKSSVSLFIAEVLYNILIHPQPDNRLYLFIENIIDELNKSQYISNLNIYFLLHLADYLGITPDIYEQDSLFNLTSSDTFISDSNYYLTTQEIHFLRHIYDNYQINEINRQERQTLINKLCIYFENQIDFFKRPKSIDILRQMFD